eukprot:jgi/Ulvmu1/10809/UM069_0045.1
MPDMSIDLADSMAKRLQTSLNLSSKRSVDLGGINSPTSPALPSPHRMEYDPFVIAVAGGTASGKTTVCDLIMQRLHDQCVAIIAQDSFYKVLTPAERELAAKGGFNFDSPDAIDEDCLLHCIDELRSGRPTNVPVYDFSTHSRSKSEQRRVEPAQVIIIEGILMLHFRSVLSRAHMKVFVDSDDDVRLARRIQRDVAYRGRDMSDVIAQYTRFVKPSHDDYIAPSKRCADIIIPWHRGDNLVAVDLIVGHLKSHIVNDVLLSEFPNLHLVESTFQMRGMHTIIRDSTTPKGDFIFMADRLIRLVVEYALGLLPTEPQAVRTPTGTGYEGMRVNANVCGVSIVRSGESMEAALRRCWKGVDIGKILVSRRHKVSPGGTPGGVRNGGASGASTPPRTPPLATDVNGTYYKTHAVAEHGASENDDLIYEKLPQDIAERHVLLLDPILGTGNTVVRAMQVLLEKGCKPRNILCLTLIASRQGIKHVCTSFPDIKVITTEIDCTVDSNFRVVPGIGEFGDRYFCC